MKHIHHVYDKNIQFTINPITRAIKNESPQKTTLIQNDHNSERFTFSIPRLIEGHDMSLCNKVEVHYLNVDQKGTDQFSGFYTVEDLAVSTEDENTVVFSWLISQSCTKYAGDLNFLLRFCCVTDGTVTYAWNTDIYKNIKVGNSIDGGEMFETEYIDIIEQWKKQLTALNISVDVVKAATENANDATEAANIAAESANEAADLAKGAAGGVVTIEQNSQNPLRFWVGTKEEYEAQKDNIPENTFCIISDDMTEEELFAAIKEIQTALNNHSADIESHGNAIAGLESGKAPAGFGLGLSKAEKFLDDINEALSNGWHATSNTTENMPDNLQYCSVFVRARASGDVVQELYNHRGGAVGNNCRLNRISGDGGATWTEEWVNPPMVPNVEYRTTKRHNGKAVYVKRIEKLYEGYEGSNIKIAQDVSDVAAVRLNYLKDEADQYSILYGQEHPFFNLHLNYQGNLHYGVYDVKDVETYKGYTISFDVEYTKN